MEQLQELQAMRLNRLLTEKNISQKELAGKLGVSPTSVNHWVKGKVHMNDYNASLIHDEYPEYSVEYLRGYTPYRNNEERVKLEWLEKKRDSKDVEKSVLLLARVGGGFDVVIGSLTDSSLEPFTSKTIQVEFSRDGGSVVLGGEEWGKFADEVSAYVEMRLNLMIERGGW